MFCVTPVLSEVFAYAYSLKHYHCCPRSFTVYILTFRSPSIMHWFLDRVRCAAIDRSSTGGSPLPLGLYVKETALNACFLQFGLKIDEHYWVYFESSTMPFFIPYLFCSKHYQDDIIFMTTFLCLFLKLESGNFVLSCDHLRLKFIHASNKFFIGKKKKLL